MYAHNQLRHLMISRQLRSNLKVQYVDGTDLSQVLCTFMRQQDLGMEHMTPNDYLCMTAKVYGTDEARLNFILSLARPFFPIRKDEDGNIVLDPFNNAPINQLSGGQRRMISQLPLHSSNHQASYSLMNL